eukprot:scaffold967_cov174-Isochrysis_galbana.AAC.2
MGSDAHSSRLVTWTRANVIWDIRSTASCTSSLRQSCRGTNIPPPRSGSQRGTDRAMPSRKSWTAS